MLLLPYADEEQHAYGHAQERKRDTEHRARTINLRHVWIGGYREGGALNCPHAEPNSCGDEEKQQGPAENYERVRHDIAPALNRRSSNGPNARPDLLRNIVSPDPSEQPAKLLILARQGFGAVDEFGHRIRPLNLREVPLQGIREYNRSLSPVVSPQ